MRVPPFGCSADGDVSSFPPCNDCNSPDGAVSSRTHRREVLVTLGHLPDRLVQLLPVELGPLLGHLDPQVRPTQWGREGGDPRTGDLGSSPCSEREFPARRGRRWESRPRLAATSVAWPRLAPSALHRCSPSSGGKEKDRCRNSGRSGGGTPQALTSPGCPIPDGKGHLRSTQGL